MDRPDLIVPHQEPDGQNHSDSSTQTPSTGGRENLWVHGASIWAGEARSADRQLPADQPPAVPAGQLLAAGHWGQQAKLRALELEAACRPAHLGLPPEGQSGPGPAPQPYPAEAGGLFGRR